MGCQGGVAGGSTLTLTLFRLERMKNGVPRQARDDSALSRDRQLRSAKIFAEVFDWPDRVHGSYFKLALNGPANLFCVLVEVRFSRGRRCFSRGG